MGYLSRFSAVVCFLAVLGCQSGPDSPDQRSRFRDWFSMEKGMPWHDDQEQPEVGIGEQRRAEAHVSVPEGELPAADGLEEHVDVGEPVVEDVPLEEDEIPGEGPPERENDGGEHHQGGNGVGRRRTELRGAHGFFRTIAARSLAWRP